MNVELQRRPCSPREVFVSVVVPVYNEAEVLIQLRRLIAEGLAPCSCQYEIVFINDGSRDGSALLLDGLAATYPQVRVLHLARNFGHQAAVQAGLQHARGDAIVVMDGDLQDDPASLPRFVEAWQQGYDVVYAVRVNRKEGSIKRFLFAAFYRVLEKISSTPMPRDAGNFGLIDRRIADLLAALPERDRYYPGLRSWVGFRQTGIPVERGARYDGRPRVSLRGLFRLAKTALFSFSAVPLSFFYTAAVLSLLVFLGVGGFTLYHKFFTGQAIPGWTSLLMTACFFGALNALGIAILGEYVLRIFDQVRGRPVYVVARTVNVSEEGRGSFSRETTRSA